MNTKRDIDSLMRKTRQYEFADGLRDLQFAVFFVSLGITSWLILDLVYLPYFIDLMKVLGRPAMWLSLLLVFLPTLLGFGMLGIMNYVRRRWLWRKTGMVKPSTLMIPRWSIVLAAAIFVLSIALVFVYQQANSLLILKMLIIASGWSMGIMLIGLGLSISLARYVWLGLLGGLVSTLLLFVNLTFGQTAMALELSWGVMFAVVGIVVLWRFHFQKRGIQ